MSKEARILLVGNFQPQNFEFCWADWLKSQHYVLRCLDQNSILNSLIPAAIARKLLWKCSPSSVVRYLDWRLVSCAVDFKPNLVIVVSGNRVSRHALLSIKSLTSAVLFHFYNEDFYNRHNTGRFLREAAAVYDHFFTTKSFNVRELPSDGVVNVSYIPHGYRPNCHYPVKPSSADVARFGADVAFVGTYEVQRAAMLSYLSDYDLRVWGNNWNQARGLIPKHHIENLAVYCRDLSLVLNCTKINLAFLRKANRDLHTSRTFEIPACGAFQLSERTSEVLCYFDENKEIACFESIEELEDKIVYYLNHEAEREKIRTAGFDRCARSRYSFTDRLDSLLQVFHTSY